MGLAEVVMEVLGVRRERGRTPDRFGRKGRRGTSRVETLTGDLVLFH